MKVKCIVDLGEIGFTFGKAYKVIREDRWMDYIVYNDYGKESFLEEHECEVIEEQSSEWSGEYLPPVGTVCECITSKGCYLPCTVVDHGKDYVVVHFHPNDFNIKVDWTRHGCRPIKSEKDKEIEEIVNLYEDVMPVEAFAKKLYEHGYRKTK